MSGIKHLIGSYLSKKYGNQSAILALTRELEKERKAQNLLWEIVARNFDQLNPNYKAQYRQDLFADLFFNGKREGFYVDIGAWDGVTFSNSFALEQKGWKGILVEPNPVFADTLRENRKGIVENICISDRNNQVEFLLVEGYASMLSGIKNSFSADHLQRIDEEISQYGGSKKSILLECLRLDTLFERHNVKVVDYLSIDTEGHEMQVLSGINFSEVDIRLIGIELDYLREPKVEELLKAQGFKRLLRLQSDVFFAKS